MRLRIKQHRRFSEENFKRQKANQYQQNCLLPFEFSAPGPKPNLFVMVARRFIITGAVQGVGYRFFAMRAAARHQVLGTVRNLPDGRVEVLAGGDREAMDHFKNDLATGPMMAEVADIEETDLPVTGRYRDFRSDH
jgi:acylphosphatase